MKRFRLPISIASALCLLALPLVLGDSNTLSLAVEVLLLIGAALCWNIFSGYTGYISLGSATYYGIGAYTLALTAQDWHIPAGFAPFLLLPLSGLLAGIFSLPLGWIALRTRRFTFMVMTLALFFLFQSLAYNLPVLTGGSEGIFLPIPDWSSTVVTICFLGGVGTLTGPIVGGLLLGSMQTIFVQQYGVMATGVNEILLGGVLLVILLLLPEGIVPSLLKRVRMWQARAFASQTRAEGPHVPALSALSSRVSEPFVAVDEASMPNQVVSAEQSSQIVRAPPLFPAGSLS